MKPEKLVLSAWGPYRGRIEIDFTLLQRRGLFLITGATGAGKTTIFDAVTYALYGCMSGEMREKNSVRSDFADAEELTCVELTMNHIGKTYTIIRSPEYLRRKKRQDAKGEFTKEKETAVLHMPDGTILAGVSEVNRRMQEILVLDYRQFKQISMIAQGEFAKLLTASPSEKTRIFREIFNTSVYDRFASNLRSRSGEQYKQIMEYTHRMEEDIHLLRTEEKTEDDILAELWEGESPDYEKKLQKLAEAEKVFALQAAEADNRYTSLEKQLSLLTDKIRVAQEINEKLSRLKEANLEYQRLQEGRQDNLNQKKDLQKAKSAAALDKDYLSCENAEKLLQTNIDRKKQTESELLTLQKKQKELSFFYINKEQIEEAYTSRLAYEEKRKMWESAADRTEKKQKELGKLQDLYLRQEAVTKQEKEKYDRADLIYKRAAVGIAARLLRDGEPCPVCGSKEHPQTAVVTKEVPDEEGLQLLRQLYENENKKLMQLHGKTAALRGEVQNRQEQCEEMKIEMTEYENRCSKIPDHIAEMTYELSKKEWEERLDYYTRITVQLEEKTGILLQCREEITQLTKQKEELEQLFVQKCKEVGFSSLQSYSESILTAGQMAELENKIADYDKTFHTLQERISHWEEETKEKKQEDISVLQETCNNLKKEKQEAFALQAALGHRLKDIKRVRKACKEKWAVLSRLYKEYGLVKDLDNLVSGNNSKRLVFEQYVLAGYFEDILRAANIRLEKMTAGRYALFRSEEVTDGRTKDNLEIRVLDYYTGKYRSARTLSGGESFKASLSLALGMSDVIQAYSGGIRAEALFIDEGFGSLDSESLEQACQTLMSLAEKDKLIGIISHVPELCDKIQNKIVVTKTSIGSSVKIVV